MCGLHLIRLGCNEDKALRYAQGGLLWSYFHFQLCFGGGVDLSWCRHIFTCPDMQLKGVLFLSCGSTLLPCIRCCEFVAVTV